MIYVEINLIDLNTNKLAGKYSKQFDMIGDFTSWYKIAKEDEGMIINIMKYNPMEYPLRKQLNDVKLLSMSREQST